MRRPMNYRDVPRRAPVRIAGNEDQAQEQRDPPDQVPDESSAVAGQQIVHNPRPFRVRVTRPERSN